MADLGPAFARGGAVGQINIREERGIARRGLDIQQSAVEQKREAAEATIRAKQVTELKEDTKSLLEIGISSISQASTSEQLEAARQFAVRSFEGVLKRAEILGASPSVILAAQNRLDKTLSQKEAALLAGKAKGAGEGAAKIAEATQTAPVVGPGPALEAAGFPVTPETPEEEAVRAGLVAEQKALAQQEVEREAREEAALGVQLSPEAQTQVDQAPPGRAPILRLELLAEAAVNQGNNDAAREFRTLAKIKASRVASEGALGPREKARETKLGALEALSFGRISSIKATIAALDKTSSIISDEPTSVGFLSNLKRKGQAGLDFLREAGFTDTANQLLEFASSKTELSRTEAEGFFSDRNLSQLKLLENQIGVALARLDFDAQGGTGRLPVELIKQGIKAVQLTGLTSGRQIKERLSVLRERFVAAQTGLETRFGGKASAAPTPAVQQPFPVFNITADGLQQVEP